MRGDPSTIACTGFMTFSAISCSTSASTPGSGIGRNGKKGGANSASAGPDEYR